jgi:hypothetical protein
MHFLPSCPQRKSHIQAWIRWPPQFPKWGNMLVGVIGWSTRILGTDTKFAIFHV